MHGLKANSPSAALSVTLRATFFFGPRGNSPPALLPRRGLYRPGQRPSAAGLGPWPGEGRPLPGSPQEGRAATRRFAATCRPGCEARRGAAGVGRALLTPNPGGGGGAGAASRREGISGHGFRVGHRSGAFAAAKVALRIQCTVRLIN